MSYFWTLKGRDSQYERIIIIIKIIIDFIYRWLNHTYINTYTSMIPV